MQELVGEDLLNTVSGQIVDAALEVHLKLSGKKLGLFLNFNVALMKDGIKRVAKGL